MSAVRVQVASAAAMGELGRRMALLLRAGDLVVLDGPLGAGKTTFTRGLGEGLGVRGEVTSPTFVIARRHPSRSAGPDLLHIDAYRVSAEELIDAELDLEGADAVTVVEWGGGKTEDWSAERLMITIALPQPDPQAGRVVTVDGTGGRWSQAALAEAVAA